MDTLRSRRRYALLLSLLLPLLAACGPREGVTPTATTAAATAAAASATATATPTATIPGFDHIYLIIFENKESSSVIGSTGAPYLNQLAARGGVGLNYHAVAHPSQPNYLALFSGSTHGVSDDGHYDLPGQNLADQLEAHGLSWRVFAENVPPGCYKGDRASDGPDGAGSYARKHEPAISFIDISSNPDRCDNITDFSHFDPAAADFELIVPNLCHDMHDCSVAAGDQWLKSWLPGHILDTPAWQQSNSLLLITFDEGNTNAGGGGLVPLIVLSHQTPAGLRSDTAHDHYGLLRTIEDSWNLGCLNQSCDAAPVTEFFPPSGR